MSLRCSSVFTDYYHVNRVIPFFPSYSAAIDYFSTSWLHLRYLCTHTFTPLYPAFGYSYVVVTLVVDYVVVAFLRSFLRSFPYLCRLRSFTGYSRLRCCYSRLLLLLPRTLLRSRLLPYVTVVGVPGCLRSRVTTTRSHYARVVCCVALQLYFCSPFVVAVMPFVALGCCLRLPTLVAFDLLLYVYVTFVVVVRLVTVWFVTTLRSFTTHTRTFGCVYVLLRCRYSLFYYRSSYPVLLLICCLIRWFVIITLWLFRCVPWPRSTPPPPTTTRTVDGVVTFGCVDLRSITDITVVVLLRCWFPLRTRYVDLPVITYVYYYVTCCYVVRCLALPRLWPLRLFTHIPSYYLPAFSLLFPLIPRCSLYYNVPQLPRTLPYYPFDCDSPPRYVVTLNGDYRVDYVVLYFLFRCRLLLLLLLLPLVVVVTLFCYHATTFCCLLLLHLHVDLFAAVTLNFPCPAVIHYRSHLIAFVNLTPLIPTYLVVVRWLFHLFDVLYACNIITLFCTFVIIVIVRWCAGILPVLFPIVVVILTFPIIVVNWWWWYLPSVVVLPVDVVPRSLLLLLMLLWIYYYTLLLHCWNDDIPRSCRRYYPIRYSIPLWWVVLFLLHYWGRSLLPMVCCCDGDDIDDYCWWFYVLPLLLLFHRDGIVIDDYPFKPLLLLRYSCARSLVVGVFRYSPLIVDWRWCSVDCSSPTYRWFWSVALRCPFADVVVHCWCVYLLRWPFVDYPTLLLLLPGMPVSCFSVTTFDVRYHYVYLPPVDDVYYVVTVDVDCPLRWSLFPWRCWRYPIVVGSFPLLHLLNVVFVDVVVVVDVPVPIYTPWFTHVWWRWFPRRCARLLLPFAPRPPLLLICCTLPLVVVVAFPTRCVVPVAPTFLRVLICYWRCYSHFTHRCALLFVDYGDPPPTFYYVGAFYHVPRYVVHDSLLYGTFCDVMLMVVDVVIVCWFVVIHTPPTLLCVVDSLLRCCSFPLRSVVPFEFVVIPPASRCCPVPGFTVWFLTFIVIAGRCSVDLIAVGCHALWLLIRYRSWRYPVRCLFIRLLLPLLRYCPVALQLLLLRYVAVVALLFHIPFTFAYVWCPTFPHTRRCYCSLPFTPALFVRCCSAFLLLLFVIDCYPRLIPIARSLIYYRRVPRCTPDLFIIHAHTPARFCWLLLFGYYATRYVTLLTLIYVGALVTRLICYVNVVVDLLIILFNVDYWFIYDCPLITHCPPRCHFVVMVIVLPLPLLLLLLGVVITPHCYCTVALRWFVVILLLLLPGRCWSYCLALIVIVIVVVITTLMCCCCCTLRCSRSLRCSRCYCWLLLLIYAVNSTLHVVDCAVWCIPRCCCCWFPVRWFVPPLYIWHSIIVLIALFVVVVYVLLHVFAFVRYIVPYDVDYVSDYPFCSDFDLRLLLYVCILFVRYGFYRWRWRLLVVWLIVIAVGSLLLLLCVYVVTSTARVCCNSRWCCTFRPSHSHACYYVILRCCCPAR